MRLRAANSAAKPNPNTAMLAGSGTACATVPFNVSEKLSKSVNVFRFEQQFTAVKPKVMVEPDAEKSGCDDPGYDMKLEAVKLVRETVV